MGKSFRLERNLKAIKDSDYDPYVIKDILMKYNKDIEAETQRGRSSKNGFIQHVCRQNVDELTKEKNQIDALVG